MYSIVRTEDTVARIGGDEFVIILNCYQDQHVPERIAQKLLHHISLPIHFENNQFNISCSIGIAIYPEHGNSFHTLRTKADAAMYAVKNSGKNNYAFAKSPTK